MKFLLCTAVLVGCSIAASVRPRIVGGQEALPHEFPYMVSLQWIDLPERMNFCGGTLLSEKWVLTAGHCVDKDLKNNAEIVAGAHSIKNPDEFEQRRKPLRIIIHENYTGTVKPHDIALIEVSEPFVFNKNVKSIQITTKEHEYPSGQVTVSGWGSMSMTRLPDLPDKLMKVDLPIVDSEICHTKYPETGMHETNFCAGNLDEQKTACSGDSGSPLVQKNSQGQLEILGITSWTWVPCGEIGKTTVFVNLSHYKKWISEKMNS